MESIFHQVQVSTSETDKIKLNIEDKTRSNLFKWNGQFSPQLVEHLLKVHSKPGHTIFDPFLGSGTILLESGRLGLSAFGTEINPAAVFLSHTYEFINLEIGKRKLILEKLENELIGNIANDLPLFVDSQVIKSHDDYLSGLVKFYRNAYSPESRKIIETFITLLDVYNTKLNSIFISQSWTKLKSLILGLPFSKGKLKVYNLDSRDSLMPESSIDLVVTSPPYINVFNYHQQYRRSLEILDWNLLNVAKSEFGSNRKHRSNRFLTVIQFCLDISQTFSELNRICKKNSQVIFVVGRESSVRGARFFNGELVSEVAHYAAGFTLEDRKERVFLNRFGQNIFEDILFFRCNKASENVLVEAREVSRRHLESAKKNGPQECLKEIVEALAMVSEVQPSPNYKPENARGQV